jgi:hypothetical protein
MTNEELVATKEKIFNQVMNFLPLMQFMEWSCPATATKHYIKWRKKKDLFYGIVEYCGCRNTKEKQEIMQNIIDIFYGGDVGFAEYIKEMQKGLPDIIIFKETVKV